jgi:hypothetical protein
MDVVVAPAVRALLEGQKQKAVTVDVTLRFCGGLVTKDAVAVAGTPPEGAGFNHVALDGGLDLFWRQRFDVEGADPSVSTRVSPRRVRLTARGPEMHAEASY